MKMHENERKSEKIRSFNMCLVGTAGTPQSSRSHPSVDAKNSQANMCDKSLSVLDPRKIYVIIQS